MLQPLTAEKAEAALEHGSKMKRDLKLAFELAAKEHSLDFYKEMLNNFHKALAKEQERLEARTKAASDAKGKSKKAKAAADVEGDLDMPDDQDDADGADTKAKKSKKRKVDDDTSVSSSARAHTHTHTPLEDILMAGLTFLTDTPEARLGQEAENQADELHGQSNQRDRRRPARVCQGFVGQAQNQEDSRQGREKW